MYSRLKLARNLLRDDGVIFISIGDSEIHNLKKICDEIFGEENSIVTFSRMMKSGGAKGRFYTPSIDYVLSYAKNIIDANEFRGVLNNDQIERFYNKIEAEGERKGERYGEDRIYKASLEARPNQRYYIKCPDGSYVIPPGKTFPQKIAEGEKVLPGSEDGVWKWIYSKYLDEYKKGNIVFKNTNTSALVNQFGEKSPWNLYNKLWLTDQQEKGLVPSNFIENFENRQSSAELKDLCIPFDYAKPVNLIKYFITLSNQETNALIMDFFAGSSSTAQAVMCHNAENYCSNKFIMVQLYEPCDPKSEAFKAGFKTIAEISKERIRRAGKKIKDELEDKKREADKSKESENSFLSDLQEKTGATVRDPSTLDIGFRVLKIDDSNMENVYYTPDAVVQKDLFTAVDNVKNGRTSEDLLFQVLLDWGVDLTLPIVKEMVKVNNSKEFAVYIVDTNSLFACFDSDITEGIVEHLAARRPMRMVFRDSGFISDSVKINVDQIFKQLSPNTEVKSI
jgi:adenine-specific DNA-methyltransferase